MKAITIRQPFSWLIVVGKKNIENRSWKTAYRGPLLIHAGMQFHDMSFSEIEDRYGVKLPPAEEMRRGGIVGSCQLVDCVEDHRSKWFEGPFGFVLRDATRRPFKSISGGLGLWDYPRRRNR